MRTSGVGLAAGALGVAAVLAIGATAAGAREQAAAGQGYKVVGTWGKTGTANGQFRNASGIAVDKAEKVYVADSDNNRVQVFSKAGALLTKWGSEGRGNGQFSLAEDVDLGSDGTVWVGDQGNGRAQAFSATGAFKTSLPQPTGELARGVAVDAGGNVYVAAEGTQGGYRRFAKNATGWDGAGPVIGAVRFSRPEDIEASPDGSIYLVRTPTQGGGAQGGGSDEVQRFSADGKLLGSFKLGVAEGGRGIAVDLDCNVWAPDWSKAGGFVKHSPSGKVLGTVTLPYIGRDVAVGPHGDLYALIQNGGVVHLAEDKKKPGTAGIPKSIAVKGGKARIPYAAHFACPAQVTATASIKGAGVSGRVTTKVAAGRKTPIAMSVHGPAGKTVKATFTIVLRTNGRPTTETRSVVVSFGK